MSTSDFEGYSLRLADKHGQPRSMLAASLEKASSFLASSPSGRVRSRYARDYLLELSTKKECNVCPAEVPIVLRKDNQGPGTGKEEDGILIQKGPRNIPGKGVDSEGRSPQENAPASWHNDRDQNAWRHSGRPRSFEDEPPHNGMRGPHRGGSDRDRERWDRERGEKEMGTSAPRNSGPRPYLENHRPMNPPGFGGARWGESRPGPGGRFRPDERDRDGYSGPGGRGPGPHGPPGLSRPLWDGPPARDRGPPGTGPARPGPGFDRRGPPDEKRGPPARPTGGSTWDDDNYKDDETFGFDDPKQQTGLEKEEEEKRRRAQFEREFEEMRKARHKKPEAAAADGEPPSKKHDEDGIWDTNLSFEESSTTTTITTGGQVNRRTVTSTVTGLRPPPGFGNGAPGNGPLAGPVTPRTPRASDGDWRINKRTVVEETVEPAKEKTPATAAADSNAVKGGGGDAAQKSEGKNEGGHGKAPGGPSLLDSIFASGEKGARETKEEGGGAKTGESLVLKNLFKNAHRKVFPGLDDDPVTDAVLSDRWADAVEAEEADAKASKFARWFKKTEEPTAAPAKSAEMQKEDNSLASSALMSMLQKPGPTLQKSGETSDSQPGAPNPLNLLFPPSASSGGSKAMPAGPSLAEIEQAMRTKAGDQKQVGGSSEVKADASSEASTGLKDAHKTKEKAAESALARVKSPERKVRPSREPAGVAVKGLRDLVEQGKQNNKSGRRERATSGGAPMEALKDALEGKLGSGPSKEETDSAQDALRSAQSDDQGKSASSGLGAKVEPAANGKASFLGGGNFGAGPDASNPLASIFGAGPGQKPAGVPGKKADGPVFMTLEDIEKSMLEEAGKAGAAENSKPAPAPAALKAPAGKADVVASMHLLSLLKKGPQSAQPTGTGAGDSSKEGGGAAESRSRAPKESVKDRVNGLDLDGGWSFPEAQESDGGMKRAAVFGSDKGAPEMEQAGKHEGLFKGVELQRPPAASESELLESLGVNLKDAPRNVDELFLRRHLAGHETGASRFFETRKQSAEEEREAAPSNANNLRQLLQGPPEDGGWPGGPPGHLYGGQQSQQQLPPGMVPPPVMQHQQHQQLPPHLAGLWPYGANGAPFGPGPPSGSFFGGERGPFPAGEGQSQALERQNSGSSNGPSQGPFGQLQGPPGSMQGPSPPGLLPSYAFGLRGLVPMAGPQALPPQFAHLNGPLPGGYMRPLFNMPYMPEGLHAAGPPHAIYGPPSSQSGRPGEQQISHRPPQSQYLGGNPYGADFWGGGQPGGLSSGEGMPSAAR